MSFISVWFTVDWRKVKGQSNGSLQKHEQLFMHLCNETNQYTTRARYAGWIRGVKASKNLIWNFQEGNLGTQNQIILRNFQYWPKSLVSSRNTRMPNHLPIPSNVEVRFDIVEIAVVAIELSKEGKSSRRRALEIAPHLTATNSIRDALLANLWGVIKKFSRSIPLDSRVALALLAGRLIL